jgi:hypothetical protein
MLFRMLRQCQRTTVHGTTCNFRKTAWISYSVALTYGQILREIMVYGEDHW